MTTFLGYSNFNGKNGDKFSADLLYDIIEQNIAGNYTVVRLYGYIRSWGYSGSGSYCTFYINGENCGGFSSITANQYSEVARKDVTVYHDAVGNGTLSWSLSVDTSWTLGDASASGSLALPTIPRTSSVTCTDGYIESAVSININRASDSFYHTLKYSFGSLSGTIAEGVGTSYGWTIPSSFYSQIPNSTSGVGTITCETYINGTLVGTSYCNFTARTDEPKCKPTVTATIVDINSTTIALTSDSNKIVKGVSNVKVNISATAKNSASISSRKVTCADGKEASGVEVTLNSVDSGNFIISAKDSRGYTTSIAIDKTLINYIDLTLNPTFYRPEPTTGEVKLKYDGNYFDGSFGATNNSLTVKYRYKESTKSSWDDIEYIEITSTIDSTNNKYSNEISLGTDFDYQKSYDFEIVAFDEITKNNPVVKTAHVSEGIPMLALFKKLIEMFGITAFEISEDGKTLIINGNIKISESNKLLKNL